MQKLFFPVAASRLRRVKNLIPALCTTFHRVSLATISSFVDAISRTRRISFQLHPDPSSTSAYTLLTQSSPSLAVIHRSKVQRETEFPLSE